MTAEMKCFLSAMFNMGFTKRNKLNDYWKTKYERQSIPWFRKMFNHSQFLQILCSFHIVDNDKLPPKTDPSYRSCARIRPLLANATCYKFLYTLQTEYTRNISLTGLSYTNY